MCQRREAELLVLGREGISRQKIVESDRISLDYIEGVFKKMNSG